MLARDSSTDARKHAADLRAESRFVGIEELQQKLREVVVLVRSCSGESTLGIHRTPK